MYTNAEVLDHIIKKLERHAEEFDMASLREDIPSLQAYQRGRRDICKNYADYLKGMKIVWVND